MNPYRADELISLLNLAPHPEGGYYREVYRSERQVAVSPAGEKRSAVTSIYFLLTEGQLSKWHQIDSDELWHYYEGELLELIWFLPGGSNYTKQILGPLSPRSAPEAVIPAGAWQAAHPLGSYTLVGCTVAPGFEFKRFCLLSQTEDEAEALKRKWPELQKFL